MLLLFFIAWGGGWPSIWPHAAQVMLCCAPHVLTHAEAPGQGRERSLRKHQPFHRDVAEASRPQPARPPNGPQGEVSPQQAPSGPAEDPILLCQVWPAGSFRERSRGAHPCTCRCSSSGSTLCKRGRSWPQQPGRQRLCRPHGSRTKQQDCACAGRWPQQSTPPAPAGQRPHVSENSERTLNSAAQNDASSATWAAGS